MVFEEILTFAVLQLQSTRPARPAPEVEGGCLPGLTSSTCLSRVGTFTGSDGGLGSEVRFPRAAACAAGVRFAWCSAAGALSGAKAGAALDTTHPGPCAWGKEGSDTTPSLLQAHPSLFPHACFASAASGPTCACPRITQDGKAHGRQGRPADVDRGLFGGEHLPIPRARVPRLDSQQDSGTLVEFPPLGPGLSLLLWVCSLGMMLQQVHSQPDPDCR